MPDPKADAAEAAAIRRRWITLGEVLAVIAVVISGLTFWNSYQERTSSAEERAAAKQEEKAKAQTLLLRAEVEDRGRRLALTPADAEQVIQNQSIVFPSGLEMGAPIDTVMQPRIEAGWLQAAVKKIDKMRRKGPGDQRMPVAITTSFVAGGKTYSDTAIYDIGYQVEEGGFLEGDEVKLKGLSRVERVSGGKASARLDALWKSRQPSSFDQELSSGVGKAQIRA